MDGLEILSEPLHNWSLTDGRMSWPATSRTARIISRRSWLKSVVKIWKDNLAKNLAIIYQEVHLSLQHNITATHNSATQTFTTECTQLQ